MSIISKDSLDKKNIINFTITWDILNESLLFLSPFAKIQSISEYSEEEEENEDLFVLSELFFADKVTFNFYKNHLSLYVLADGVMAERCYSISSPYNGLSFCVSIEKLSKEISRHRNSILAFVEDRFFGFSVYDKEYDNHLFDIEAFSVRTQPSYIKSFKATYPKVIKLEHKTLVDSLNLFAKYTEENTYRLYEKSIWYHIQNGTCTVKATNNIIFRSKDYTTHIEGKHLFSIPGKYAEKFNTIITKWTNSTPHRLYFNSEICRLSYYNKKNGVRESLLFPQNNVNTFLLNTNFNNLSIRYRATISLVDLKSALRINNAILKDERFAVLRFTKDVLNIYCDEKISKTSIRQNIEVQNCEEDFVIRLNRHYLEQLITELDSEYVRFEVIDTYLLRIIGNNDNPSNGEIRILSLAKIREDSCSLP